MEADVHSNLTGIAVVALAALVCGFLMERLRQPAIVGYIVAGVVLGPSGAAVVEGRGQISVLAEMGVLMLLFIVGMELSLRSFRRIWRLALMTTLCQIGGSVGVMLVMSNIFGWSLGMSILLGFVVAMSSTAVAIKVLEDLRELRTRAGRIAVGVLIAQDLAVVPMMLIVAAMGGDGFDWLAIPKIVFSVAFLVGLIMYLSRGRKIDLPFARMVAGHVDLKPLAALAFCFGWAALSGLMGLSAAYGAFLAGLIIGASTERHAMLEATQPIQSILMMVFFLSIGLLIDLDYLWRNVATVLSLFFMVAVFKTVLNITLLRSMGQTWHQAFLAGIMLSQIGEFSFLLSVVGAEAGVINADDSRLVVAVTVLSLSLSPLWVLTARRLRLMAEYGVTEVGAILRLVYAPEAELVADTLGEARSRGQRQMRKTALWLRRHRLRRQRAKAAKRAAKESQAPQPQPASAPASSPTPDPEPPPEESLESSAKVAAPAKPKAKVKPKAKQKPKTAPKKKSAKRKSVKDA